MKRAGLMMASGDSFLTVIEHLWVFLNHVKDTKAQLMSYMDREHNKTLSSLFPLVSESM